MSVAGQGFVVTAWLDYRPGSELLYHELLSTMLVRWGPYVGGCITQIWVDSVASRNGGRTLWGIPKELATLDFHGGRSFTALASTADDWIATTGFSATPLRSPCATPARLNIIQELGGYLVRTRLRAQPRVQLARANWRVNPDGALGYLADHSPVASMVLPDSVLYFGV